jgi:hypothetical protein
MLYYSLIGLLMCSDFLCHGQSVSTLMGARTAGLGNASTAVTDDAALFNNIGALAYNKSSSFFAYEALPQLEGANRMAAAIQSPLLKGVAALGLFKFGDDLYSEQIVSTGFSHKLAITSLGIRINYVQYNAASSGIRHAMSLDFGGLTQITPHIALGAYITNLTQSKISDDEFLPTILSVGISLKPEDNILFTTEITKDLDYPAVWKAGMEYNVQKKIFFRTGFNLNPSALHAGLGVSVRKLKIDYAAKFSSALGIVHQGSATLQLGKKIEK